VIITSGRRHLNNRGTPKVCPVLVPPHTQASGRRYIYT